MSTGRTPTYHNREHKELYEAMLGCKPNEILKGGGFVELYSTGDHCKNAYFYIELTCKLQIARNEKLMALECTENLTTALCEKLLKQHDKLMVFQDILLKESPEKGDDIPEWVENIQRWRELKKDWAELRVALVLAEMAENADSRVSTRSMLQCAAGPKLNELCGCVSDCVYVNRGKRA